MSRRRLATTMLSLPIVWAASEGRARADGAFPDAQTVLLPADRPQQIVVASNFGLVFSEDDGAHWQYSCETQATTNGRLYSLGARPTYRIFSLSDYGVVTTADSGCTWKVGGGPFTGGLVLDYFADPVDADHVLAVAEPPAMSGLLPAQVFESHDGGLDYDTVLHPGLTDGGVAGVEIARSDPRVIYVALYQVSPADTLTHPRLARTSDAGANWETIDLEPMLGASRVTIAAVDPNDAARLYLRVSGTGSDGRSVDSIAVSADGGLTFARPVNLSGGKLMTFFARANGTVLTTGLLGATVVGYRSLDAGATFASWSPSLHPRGFGERGTTLFMAIDQSMDGFALASSENDGDTWARRMDFGQVEAIRSCAQQACLDDCWQKVTIELWQPPVCGQPPVEPGADGGTHSGGGGGGCSAAGSPGGSNAGWLAICALVFMLARRRLRRFAGAAAFAAAIIVPAAAHAYVRNKTPAGVAEFVPGSCVALEVHLDDFPGIDADAVRAAATAAARAWSADANPCTNLTFALTFAGGPGPPPRNDGVNVLGARSEGWCPNGTDAATAVTVDAGPTCNAPSATAATTVFVGTDGRIVDGDTELNTLTVAWAVLDAQGNPSNYQDLQSVLTHEIGHRIGLAHPCWSGFGDRGIDDSGNPVPDCYAAPPAIADDTMYPTINPGDISRRVLSPDALRAVCEIYPASNGAATCPSRSASGCTVAADGGPLPERQLAVVFFVLVPLLAAVIKRKNCAR